MVVKLYIYKYHFVKRKRYMMIKGIQQREFSFQQSHLHSYFYLYRKFVVNDNISGNNLKYENYTVNTSFAKFPSTVSNLIVPSFSHQSSNRTFNCAIVTSPRSLFNYLSLWMINCKCLGMI
ncbi:unnamed protein product [Schistosoma margrebowiei]|uniref:Uncharacterized protein n=1 Tax=Schistosoma margrebowiei TaxID=48269 RepID=A0AA84ZSM2_9TREM|nr:unnamed protein product [Schistosoma margrebowiei]